MEKELNIAAILKDKSKYTKLYSPLYGEVFLNRIVSTDGIRVLCKNIDGLFGTDEKSFWKNGKFTLAGEVCLFPSKGMQDWSKFAWKKGDVLFCGVDNFCIFDKWANNQYTEFYGRYSSQNYSKEYDKLDTECWTKVGSNGTKQAFIKRIEEFHNGKLNLSTLQIEQPKQEFKDGDIVRVDEEILIILKRDEVFSTYYHFFFKSNGTTAFDGSFNKSGRKYRLATDSEKQQLFSALEKEGKAWDAEKKAIVDLPKKCELKPLDYFMAKFNGDDRSVWYLHQYSFERKGILFYVNEGCMVSDKYTIIPYNNQTKHLLGTTDEWKGGEG